MTPMVHRLILFLSMMMKYQCDAFFSIPSRSGFKRSEISSNAKYTTLLSAAQSTGDGGPTEFPSASAGKLEELKQEERRLASMLATIRRQKIAVLKARPLTIGIIGFGRFGQFIAKSFAKYGSVIGSSRTDYTHVTNEIGIKFVPLSALESLVVDEDLDVIVLAVSIVSFEETVKELVPHLQKRMEVKGRDSCPLIVDVASVKEHPRKILLENLPEECDICCTHPMFGPDSAARGWDGLTFVYEKTRINKIILDGVAEGPSTNYFDNDDITTIEGMDRVERFLVSPWRILF
jgi:hypothetical protein